MQLYMFTYLCRHVCTCLFVCRHGAAYATENHLWKSSLSVYSVDTRDGTLILRLRSRCLKLLSHFLQPSLSICMNLTILSTSFEGNHTLSFYAWLIALTVLSKSTQVNNILSYELPYFVHSFIYLQTFERTNIVRLFSLGIQECYMIQELFRLASQNYLEGLFC